MKPIVAVVGRPNVGKSTLFNRLTRSRSAIVHDEPGVTRDRHYGHVERGGRKFILIDTGGFDPHAEDPMKQGIKAQILAALDEADVIVCVLDAREPATSIDHAEMGLLRRAQKNTIFVANKADNDTLELESMDLYRLGIDGILPVSALHGRNMDELEDAILAALPKESPEESALDEDSGPAGAPRIAIIGKPNAGKSSLLNRLLGEERMLVDDKPGTTRAAIDAVIVRGDKPYVFIDTAGIRRKAKVKKEGDYVETASVLQAMRAMERADIVILMTDSKEGVAEQDAKILGLAVERGRAVIVGLNKIDLLDKGELQKQETDAKDKLSFAPWAKIVRLSTKTGRGIDTLLAAIDTVAACYEKRVGTGELNRFFEKVLLTHPPPTNNGKAPRLYFITQAETKPPVFVVQASDPDQIHFSYQRYVQNQIRKTFEFEGVPLLVHYRRRRRRDLSTPEGRAGISTKPRRPGEDRKEREAREAAEKAAPSKRVATKAETSKSAAAPRSLDKATRVPRAKARNEPTDNKKPAEKDARKPARDGKKPFEGKKPFKKGGSPRGRAGRG